jgi:hypothetical protein
MGHLLIYHPWVWAFQHLLRWYCYLTTFCAVTANKLPSDKRLECYPRARKLYLDFIVVWCGLAWNIRKDMPSADLLEADDPYRKRRKGDCP